MKKFRISEIFESIQGESIYSGFPFLFVRFFGCNVRCIWCDTKYSWQGSKFQEYSMEELFKKIIDNKRDRILLTGGEPLLQENIVKLIEKLIINKKEVHIETSGASDISQLPFEIHIIMDIKPPSAKAKTTFFEKNLDYLKKNDEIKIVVDDMDDFKFLLNYEKKYELSKRFLLSLSPTPKFIENGIDIQKLVMDTSLNIRINFQLHKYFFSDNC